MRPRPASKWRPRPRSSRPPSSAHLPASLPRAPKRRSARSPRRPGCSHAWPRPPGSCPRQTPAPASAAPAVWRARPRSAPPPRWHRRAWTRRRHPRAPPRARPPATSSLRPPGPGALPAGQAAPGSTPSTATVCTYKNPLILTPLYVGKGGFMSGVWANQNTRSMAASTRRSNRCAARLAVSCTSSCVSF